MQINKSDRNDAIGIARIMQTGWFKEVHVKDIDSHSVRALLASRALLVKIKRDLENHVRGLLKNLGLVIGRAKFNVFAVRTEELIEGRPELMATIRPLLEARNAVGQQVSELDRKVIQRLSLEAKRKTFTCDEYFATLIGTSTAPRGLTLDLNVRRLTRWIMSTTSRTFPGQGTPLDDEA
jgi:transposase